MTTPTTNISPVLQNLRTTPEEIRRALERSAERRGVPLLRARALTGAQAASVITGKCKERREKEKDPTI